MKSPAQAALTVIAIFFALFALVAKTEPLIVKKQFFEISRFTTDGGATITDVRLGYETYGKLNSTADNVIFVSHFYSGSSHAAGKYAQSDAASGYWDTIIGPGKPIDTDKYFVVSADTFANLNVGDPNVVTTGPASIDPASGKPYGLRFPVVSLRDTGRAPKLQLDSLGVRGLVAAVGASGGAIQAMEWAALYPDFVKRVVHVIGPGFEIHPWAVAMVDLWVTPIRMDPAWKHGDFYGEAGPRVGLSKALKLLTLTARHWRWANAAFDYSPSGRLPSPATKIDGQFQIVDALDVTGESRAALIDPNHMIYMSRAGALYRLTAEEVRGIKAKILFVPAESDLIFPPEFSLQAVDSFRKIGGRAELFMLRGTGGHLDGLFEIQQAAQPIRSFLESP